jgi:hypothetical protein
MTGLSQKLGLLRHAEVKLNDAAFHVANVSHKIQNYCDEFCDNLPCNSVLSQMTRNSLRLTFRSFFSTHLDFFMPLH